jgi:hypothetical protein
MRIHFQFDSDKSRNKIIQPVAKKLKFHPFKVVQITPDKWHCKAATYSDCQAEKFVSEIRLLLRKDVSFDG